MVRSQHLNAIASGDTKPCRPGAGTVRSAHRHWNRRLNRGAVAAVGALSPTGTELFLPGYALGDTAGKSDPLGSGAKRSPVRHCQGFQHDRAGNHISDASQKLERKYGSSSHERIIAIGSGGEGQLHHLAQRHQWEFLAFPADINGRYSVLSTVGLFPMAVAGVDIESLIAGGIAEHQRLATLKPLMNPAVRYAAVRNLLSKQGSIIEALVIFEPAWRGSPAGGFSFFGESEGKRRELCFRRTSLFGRSSCDQSICSGRTHHR